MLTNEERAAAAARIKGRAVRERSALVGLLRSCFARTQTWRQAEKYLSALVSQFPSRNGWIDRRARWRPTARPVTAAAKPGQSG